MPALTVIIFFFSSRRRHTRFSGVTGFRRVLFRSLADLLRVLLKAKSETAGVAQKLIARDRKSVVQGKSVSARVDLGGRRIIKKKKKQPGRETPLASEPQRPTALTRDG